jgi:nucleotide-binding universal stress UspA family protein
VQDGRPGDAIVAFANERRMDLIVMGRRAWAPESQPMWRTAYSVVTQACCPVLSMQTPLPSATPAM